jgi:hypothetical protein
VALEECPAGCVAVEGADVACFEAVADVAAADGDLLRVLQLVVKLEQRDGLDLWEAKARVLIEMLRREVQRACISK